MMHQSCCLGYLQIRTHKRRNEDVIVFIKIGTYLSSSPKHIFLNDHPTYVGVCKYFDEIMSTSSLGTLVI